MRHIPILFSLFLLGCSFTPQQVNVDLPAQHVTGTEGAGKSLQVAAADVRKEKGAIGYWGKPDKNAAPITIKQDIAAPLQANLAQGFAAHGFDVKAANSPRKVSVELRQLAYANDYSSTIWTIGLQLHVTLHAEAVNGKGHFSQDYTTSYDKRWMKAPSMEENQLYVNRALAGAAQKLVNDPALLAFLGK